MSSSLATHTTASRAIGATTTLVEGLAKNIDPKTLTENFAVIAEAHGSVDTLRRLVLDLAVHGKLVPQQAGTSRPEDIVESESVEQGPFVLPASWGWVPLQRVADLQIGRTPATKQASYWAGEDEGHPWVSISDMTHSGVVHHTKRRISEEAAKKVFRLRSSPRGTLIMSFKLTIGKVALLGCEAFHNEAIVSIFPHDPRMKEYLFRVLPRLTHLGDSKAAIKGATLNSESLENLLIAVPPLAEQERIVTKVDQLMALCDELEARQTKKRETNTRFNKSALDALVTAESREAFDRTSARVSANFDILVGDASRIPEIRSHIVELAVRGRLTSSTPSDGRTGTALDPLPEAEHPFSIPDTWRWVRWGQVTSRTSSGWSPQCENRPRRGHEWGVLKVSAVSWFEFKSEENKALPVGVSARTDLAVREGDFLMSRANTAELVGRSVVVGKTPERLIISDKIVKCVFSEHVDKEFMNLYNRTSAARLHYRNHASGTSDSMKNISRAVILSLPIPLPPLAEQKRIVAKVSDLMKISDDLEASMRRSELLATKVAERLASQTLEG